MTQMEQEILEESSKLTATFATNEHFVQSIAAEVNQYHIREIVLAARGSSDNAGIYFKYLSEVMMGITVSSSAPSVVTVYEGCLDLSDKLVIGISQSGCAEDVLSVLNLAKRQGAITVSITNNPESPMAQASKYHLYMNVGAEKSIAATKTFVAEMYVLAMIVSAISAHRDLRFSLQDVPALIEATYALKPLLSAKADALVHEENCYVLGRGYINPIAHELALKLQETCYLKAFAFSTSDFHHGPFALVDEKTNVIFLAQNDRTRKDSLEMMEMLTEAKARVLCFTDDPDFPAENKIVLPAAQDWIKPFVFIVAAQLFALELSLKKGLNPDQPRGLKKITITK